MLNNISLIASIISALTAITTSLRALGRSREEDFPTGPAVLRLKALMLHLLVTFIWFGLSIIFAVPATKGGLANTSSFTLIAPFALAIIICCLIWLKAVSSRDQAGLKKR